MAEYGGLHDNGKATVEAFMKMWSSLFSAGVASVGTPTSWKVTQRGAGANMSVDVAAGFGFLPGSSFYYPPYSDATVNKTITTADPSNPRRDIVVAYFDMSVPSTAVNNSQGALKFAVVAGTAAASPSDPSDSAIQSAVGSGNPWRKLARIRMGTPGAYVAPTSVVDSMVDDLRQPIAFMGNLWGGGSNTNGHAVPNVADDTLALLAAVQTFTGNKTFSGSANFTGAVNKSGYPMDWWQEIGRTTLASAADTITVTGLPARKYLRLLVSLVPTGGTISASLRYNNDSGANYSHRFSENGAADATGVSQSSNYLDPSTALAAPIWARADIVNITAQEKLAIVAAMTQGTAGGGFASARREYVEKWANTSAQINRIDVINGGTGDYALGSEVIVLGHD